jgi:vacuolar-type H+-ATPase subunit D/Vma8
MEREQEAELQRQRQIVERKRAALQSQIFVVTATYRRTQAELNALIVEVREPAYSNRISQQRLLWYTC